MKSREQKDTERFSKALATLRQKVDAVLTRAPNLMAIDRLEEIPDGQSEAIEYDLWGILLYGEYYVAKVRADLNVALRTVKNRGKNYAFYENEYPAFIEKARKLIGAANLPSTEAFEHGFVEKVYEFDDEYDEFIWDDNTLDDYEWYVQVSLVLDMVRKHSVAGRAHDPLSEGDEKIRDSFALAVEAVEYTANCQRFIFNRFYEAEYADADIPTVGFRIPTIGLRKDIFDEKKQKSMGFHRWSYFDFDPPEPFAYQKVMQNCNLVAQRFWFNPDAWLANERAISPVIVARDLKSVPKPVKSRINEIYLSLVFGNWLSAIALSRCLLEYSLLDFFPKRKDRYDENGKEVSPRQLSSVAANILFTKDSDIAAWKASAGMVFDNGNQVMHPEPPKRFDNVVKFESPNALNAINEAKAKESFVAVRKIVTALYDAKFRKG